MSRRVTCPSCGLKGELPPGYKAKHVRCARCQARFPVDATASAHPAAGLGPADSLGRTRTYHPSVSADDFEAMAPDAEPSPAAPGPAPEEPITPTWLADDDFGPCQEYAASGGVHPIVSISTASRMVGGLPSPGEPTRPAPIAAEEPWLYTIATWHAKLAGAVGVLQFPLIAAFVLSSRATGRPALEPWQSWIAVALSILVLFLIPLLAGGVLVLVDAARLLRVGPRPARPIPRP